MSQFYVYIMTNRSRTLYVGVTNDIARRVWEHKHMLTDGFTRRYRMDKLAYYEAIPDATAAILREKHIKGWVRRRKVARIESVNPDWRDLSEDFLDIRPRVQPAGTTRGRGARDSSLSSTPRVSGSESIEPTHPGERRGAQNDANEGPT